jgi:transcriptional regulator with XRE-family HTH domain/DNA polymerase III delta prime subunit
MMYELDCEINNMNCSCSILFPLKPMEKEPAKNDLLRSAREERGWTQSDLAELLDVSLESVRKWERGTRFPSAKLRKRLCELFEKTSEQLGLTVAKQAPLGEELAPSSVQPEMVVQRYHRGDKNRRRMLQRVRSRWISGLFERSLSNAVIMLELHEQSSAVANPWTMIAQETDLPARPLPHGTHITEVYNTYGDLLILGEPGAGKTTLLLELAKNLLEQATHDEEHPIPVIFNLSSWAEKRLPLLLWLVEELQTKYQVPRKLAQEWVRADQIILLLDGLDEVVEAGRVACIEAINAYRQERGFVSMVVCCRYADYPQEARRLLLNTAVVVQPLTSQQIEEYLVQAGTTSTVRQALQQDTTLQEMLSTPLMLSILTFSYQNIPMDDVLSAQAPLARQLLFQRYTERLLHRGKKSHEYNEPAVIHWLVWLANQLMQHSQTEFYLERMQPDWLDNQTRQHYRSAVLRIFSLVQSILGAALFAWLRGGGHGKISGVGWGLFGWLGGGPGNSVLGWMAPGLGGGIAGSGTVGLIFILVCSLIVQVVGSPQVPLQRAWSWVRLWRIFAHGLHDGLKAGSILAALSFLLFGSIGGWSQGMRYASVFGLFTALLVGLQSGIVARSHEENLQKESHGSVRSVRDRLIDGVVIAGAAWLAAGIVEGLLNGLREAVLYGFIIGIAFGLAYSVGGAGNQLQTDAEIQPSEMVGWSWKNMNVAGNLRQGMLVGLAIFICVIVVFGGASSVFFGPHYGFAYAAVCAIIVSITVGVAGTLTGILNSGWESNLLAEEQLLRPNEGIRRSARNSLFAASFGLVSSLAGGLASGLAFSLLGKLPEWPVLAGGFTLVFAIMFIVDFGLLRGGLACIQHYLLRWYLWRTDALPWKYSAFLDYAAEHILLRKIGGGYIFAHRLLMEYFASLNPSNTSSLSAAEEEAVSLK